MLLATFRTPLYGFCLRFYVFLPTSLVYLKWMLVFFPVLRSCCASCSSVTIRFDDPRPVEWHLTAKVAVAVASRHYHWSTVIGAANAKQQACFTIILRIKL